MKYDVCMCQWTVLCIGVSAECVCKWAGKLDDGVAGAFCAKWDEYSRRSFNVRFFGMRQIYVRSFARARAHNRSFSCNNECEMLWEICWHFDKSGKQGKSDGSHLSSYGMVRIALAWAECETVVLSSVKAIPSQLIRLIYMREWLICKRACVWMCVCMRVGWGRCIDIYICNFQGYKNITSTNYAWKVCFNHWNNIALTYVNLVLA